VKSSALSKSRLTIAKVDLTQVVAGLPKDKHGKPTLVGLTSVYLDVGSASFAAAVDLRGRVTMPFSARLSGGKSPILSVTAKSLDLITLLGLDVSTDGARSIPQSLGVVVTSSSSAPLVLFSGYSGSTLINYTVKHGTAVAR